MVAVVVEVVVLTATASYGVFSPLTPPGRSISRHIHCPAQVAVCQTAQIMALDLQYFFFLKNCYKKLVSKSLWGIGHAFGERKDHQKI